MIFTRRFGGTGKGMKAQVASQDGSGARALVAARKPDAQAEADPDAALAQVLTEFRLSAHAWSEAAYGRPRTQAAQAAKRTLWRRAGAWALGCALAAGAAGAGMYEHHHRVELARIAATRAAEHQRQLAAERARETEDLLARVDSEVSREVPNALEPLAQLMDDQNQ